MVKRDDYNYQETRQRIAGVENENKLLKMMCISLNRDFRAMKNTIVAMNANINLKKEANVNIVKENENENKNENKDVNVKKSNIVSFKDVENTLGKLNPDEIEKLLENLMEKKNIQKQSRPRKKKNEVQKNELSISLE
jgi:hypothetical protein